MSKLSFPIVLLGVLGLAGLAGCSNPAATVSVQDRSATGTSYYGFTTTGTVTGSTSVNYGRIALSPSTLALENNDWGVGTNGTGGSTSFTETVSGSSAFGWAYKVADSTAGSKLVVIYPEVGYGWSPNSNSTWGGSPVIPQIGKDYSITSNFNITSQHGTTSDCWDLAYDIWVTSAQYPSSTVGSFEIMVWLDHNVATPWTNGSAPRSVTIDGTNYNVYTSGTQANWTCLSYENTGAGIYSKTGMNLSDIIRDAAAAYGIPTSYYVSSVEFGNEVMNGSGMTQISNWAVNVNPPAANLALNAWQCSAMSSGVTQWTGGIGNFAPGSWIEFQGINLSTGYNNLGIQYATSEAGSFNVVLDSPTGTVIGTVYYPSTGGWGTYVWGGCNLNPLLAWGTHNIYLVGTSGAANLETISINND